MSKVLLSGRSVFISYHPGHQDIFLGSKPRCWQWLSLGWGILGSFFSFAYLNFLFFYLNEMRVKHLQNEEKLTGYFQSESFLIPVYKLIFSSLISSMSEKSYHPHLPPDCGTTRHERICFTDGVQRSWVTGPTSQGHKWQSGQVQPMSVWLQNPHCLYITALCVKHGKKYLFS